MIILMIIRRGRGEGEGERGRLLLTVNSESVDYKDENVN